MDDPYADVLTTETRDRCPACAAALRPGAPWCTLCYADLRAVPVPEPEPEQASVAFDPLTAPAEAFGLPGRRGSQPDPALPPAGTTWPCTACGQANAFDQAACTACGTGFLAAVRDAEAPLLVVPGIGDLGALSRGQRLAVAFGVILVVMVGTLVLSLLAS